MVCSNFAIPNASAVTFLKANAIAVTEDYVNYKAAGDRLFWIYQCEKGNVCKIDIPLIIFVSIITKCLLAKNLTEPRLKKITE